VLLLLPDRTPIASTNICLADIGLPANASFIRVFFSLADANKRYGNFRADIEKRNKEYYLA